ncbi:hypothetical protein Vafri_15319 [Volvox africanus]|uniref:RING-CH-type domain-containing protein n=1 Tax=Volvox africanus TaxID=51714 RepID=A0A8J4F5L5_9CHLO|nr:hypothetical protein Vafri_15319 [Volvox africanus]
MVQPQCHLSRLANAEAPLPNTVNSGQFARLGSEALVDYPEVLPDAITEEGTSRRSANLQPSSSLPVATAAAPAPSPARLSIRQVVSVHPLSPEPQAAPSSMADVSSSVAEHPSPKLPGQGGPTLGTVTENPCARSASGLQLPCEGSEALGSLAPECRICLLSEPFSDLVAPCHCTGSMGYAHMGCLKTWVMEKRSVHCELCGAMYKEPYGSELAASIPPALPPPPMTAVRRITTSDGQPIFIMPVGMSMGPAPMGPLLEHHAQGPHAGGATLVAGVSDPRDLEPQPLCEWRNMWSYGLILFLLLFAIIYVTVIAKRSNREPWMLTLWRVLLVVLPIYLVLRIAFDLYRHRLAQQLAAANLQAVAIANLQANAAADAAAAPGRNGVQQREVIITRSGNQLLVVQRTVS